MLQETPFKAAERLTAKLLAKGYKFEALHEYRDEQGQALYWRIRLKHPITKQKWIRPMSCNDRRCFSLKEPCFADLKPLYRLPEIIKNPTAIVWVVEGEYCADNLAAFNLLATTSGGVESAKSVDWTPLAKRKVIIWPDFDDAGLRYAKEVSLQLTQLNAEVKWVDVAQLDLPSKGDCVDWLACQSNVTLDHFNDLPLIYPLLTTSSDDIDNKTEIYSNDSLTITGDKTQQKHFYVRENGIYYIEAESHYWICSKLEIVALTRDVRSENWGRLLCFYDADGYQHRWAMPMQMLKGSAEELCGELLRLGLEIAPGARARRLIVEYLTTTKVATRAVCVTHMGWHDKYFVFPEITFGQGNVQVIYQAEIANKDYQQSGTLKEWQTHVAQLCIGNSRLILAISCAFAAMLLHPLGVESGGLHIVGESSSGKTTALRIAASVYGAANYVNRWRATTNGLEALAALRSDTLLILDELAQVDPKEAGEIAYLLANGMGKARALKNGASKQRQEWRILFLSAGEINLAQHMRESGKTIKAGQTVRLVDISADAGAGLGIFEYLHGFPTAAALSKASLEATTKYYGVAAYAYLQQLTSEQHHNEFPHLIKKIQAQFLAENLPKEAGGQVHRVAERFALIAAAGELATHYSVTGWPVQQAYQAISKCFKDWLTERGNVDNQERTMMLSQIKSFFEVHGESRFSDWSLVNSKTLNRAGFKKVEYGNTYFYVLPEVFRREICSGFDIRTVSQLLIHKQWLMPSNNNTPYQREYLPGIGRSRCYVFTNKMWEDEEAN